MRVCFCCVCFCFPVLNQEIGWDDLFCVAVDVKPWLNQLIGHFFVLQFYSSFGLLRILNTDTVDLASYAEIMWHVGRYSACQCAKHWCFVVRYSRSAACHRQSRPVYRFQQVPSVVVWRAILLQYVQHYLSVHVCVCVCVCCVSETGLHRSFLSSSDCDWRIHWLLVVHWPVKRCPQWYLWEIVGGLTEPVMTKENKTVCLSRFISSIGRLCFLPCYENVKDAWLWCLMCLFWAAFVTCMW